MAIAKAALELDLTGFEILKTASRQRAATMKAVKAAAKIVQPAAKSRAPRRKAKGGGGLRQSIGIKAEKGRRGKSLAVAVIGARKKVMKMVRPPRGRKLVKSVPAYYAHLVERGTAAHSIGIGSSRGRGNLGKATKHKVNHPGSRAQPFLGPAWAATSKEAIAAANAVMGAEIQKAIAKAAAKLAAKVK